MVTHVALASTKATNCHTDVLILNYQNETLDGFNGESNFLHTILRQENEDIVFFLVHLAEPYSANILFNN